MHVIYDAMSEYLQAMILTDGVVVDEMTELDRLFCLMVFFQMSFYKDPIEYKCPHCGVDINYRYDMSKYLGGLSKAFVDDQEVEVILKSRKFKVTIGWPTVRIVSQLTNHFYADLGDVTEEMEQTQFGMHWVFSFIKKVSVFNSFTDELEFELDMAELDWEDRLDAINELPSSVVFDGDDSLFSKITGYFINRMENCFSSETCPQCHKDTYQGLAQSSHFYGFVYGSLRGMYGYILQVECLLLYRYDCCIFDKENYMTYNDLNSLVRQIGVTAEKDNKDRQKAGHDHLYKGLWLIREILNTMIFPQDKKH